MDSVRNKLEALSEFLCTQVDFLAISEKKLDSYFPAAQFNLPGFRPPYMKDITARSGVLLVYVNRDIPSRVIFICDYTSGIQVLLAEMNLNKQKWLVVAIYTPSSQCRSYFITELTKLLDKCRNNFENIAAIGDFNMEPTNQVMNTFIADNDFNNIIKLNTYFKTSTGTCIDLILTNKPKRFQNTGVIETGVSGKRCQ